MALRCVEQSVPQQSLKREDQIIIILILHEVEADSLAISGYHDPGGKK
jgi:hypothetical protein